VNKTVIEYIISDISIHRAILMRFPQTFSNAGFNMPRYNKIKKVIHKIKQTSNPKRRKYCKRKPTNKSMVGSEA